MTPRKPYVREVPKTTWFLKQSRYQHYMLHEISSIFVAIYTGILIVGLFRLAQGPEAWNGWLAAVTSPIGIVFHLLAFVFALLHTTSWFKAVPQAMRIQRGESFVPGKLIVGVHYGVWAAVSVVVLVLAGVA
jgi:fumarate reductase subunit C